MAFIREKRRGSRSYFYLVENVRDNGKVRQKVIRYVGTRRPRLLGMDDYSRELARILRELLAAGSARDRDKMLELAQDIEKLAMVARDGNPIENPGR